MNDAWQSGALEGEGKVALKGLLIIAHGSRQVRSDAEIRRLIAAVSDLANDFDVIQHGYLEFAKPDIASGFDLLIAQGVGRVVVLPYFLSCGNHVARDVPQIIEQVKQANPQIEIKMISHIGAAADMPEYILRHLENNPF